MCQEAFTYDSAAQRDDGGAPRWKLDPLNDSVGQTPLLLSPTSTPTDYI